MARHDVEKRVDPVGAGKRHPAALEVELPAHEADEPAHGFGAAADHERRVDVLVDEERAAKFKGGFRADHPDVAGRPGGEFGLQNPHER